MLVVGLTGGIASGKSKAADLFAALGVEIIDTDIIAREVVAPGEKAYQKVIEHFGEQILQQDKQLDRKKLSDLIFNNPQEKTWLEALLHPLIREQVKQRSQQAQSNYCMVVIPLLVETQPNPLINRVLVIDVSKDIQRERIKARDNFSEEKISKILASQASREQRLAIADEVIDNCGDVEALSKQVALMHEKYLNAIYRQ